MVADDKQSNQEAISQEKLQELDNEWSASEKKEKRNIKFLDTSFKSLDENFIKADLEKLIN